MLTPASSELQLTSPESILVHSFPSNLKKLPDASRTVTVPKRVFAFCAGVWQRATRLFVLPLLPDAGASTATVPAGLGYGVVTLHVEIASVDGRGAESCARPQGRDVVEGAAQEVVRLLT